MTDVKHGTFEAFRDDGCCCVWCRDAVRIHFEASKPLGTPVQTTTGRVLPEVVITEAAAALVRLLQNRPGIDLDTVRLSRSDWPDGLSRITVQAHLPAVNPQVSDEEWQRQQQARGLA